MLQYLQTTRHLWIQLFLSPIPFINKRKVALDIETNLPTKTARDFFGSINNMNELVNGMIDERKSKNVQENFLDAMIAATDEDGGAKMTPEQLRDEAVNMLIAGHETTANALTWTWHQLLKFPGVMAKVQEEITRRVKGDAPTFEEIQQLHYTRAVFEESMRLYPPFWRISRTNLEKTTIKGFDLPAGTNIIASIYTIQRSPRYWKDPLKFDPDRFFKSETRTKFSYLPFGGGPRICIGLQFATIEAICILATTIKHVQFEKQFVADPEYFMSLTLQPKEGCQVKVKKQVA
jgi:cytochrome P450